jgi:hypothetical protein
MPYDTNQYGDIHAEADYQLSVANDLLGGRGFMVNDALPVAGECSSVLARPRRYEGALRSKAPQTLTSRRASKTSCRTVAPGREHLPHHQLPPLPKPEADHRSMLDVRSYVMLDPAYLIADQELVARRRLPLEQLVA